MPRYEVDFEYTIREYGTFETDATDSDQAEDFTADYIKDTFLDADEFEITGVRELGN